MAVDALELDEQNADPLHAVGHLETQQLFDSQRVGVRIRLGAQIIHALDERNHLLKFFLLRSLFDSGVEIPDRRRARHHRFAFELQHQPEHAVRAGMLRPHVHGHRFGAQLGHGIYNSRSTSSQTA